MKKAKKLLDAGADLTARDEHLSSTPLAWAAKFGQFKMVKFLLKRGAPKTLPDDPAWATPRAWAMRRGHTKIAELLYQSPHPPSLRGLTYCICSYIQLGMAPGRTSSRMLIAPLSTAAGGPLYLQIVASLKREISEGRLEAGAALPSFRQLAEDLLVSVITVKRAYKELERDGIIYRRQGLGTFVSDAAADPAGK